MGKVYGNRWEGCGDLGKGGQGYVYRVTDLSGAYPDTAALKRVLNPTRHERFRNEVEAIKCLDHPNVIKLLDHSAFDDGTVPEKQYLVMPVASHGDLGDRAGLYKGNIQSVVTVGIQIAQALQAAHVAEIIHRDVKPANILFPKEDHTIWLSDFGICLIRENKRQTGDGEVVGPVQFMAPELESVGELEVTPAVDVYSLGKVMFYMMSGGVILPRERLHEAEYSQYFSGGEQHRQLQMLLTRMICPLPNRIKTMAEVLEALRTIESWPSRAQVSPLGTVGHGLIIKAQQDAIEKIRVQVANESHRESEEEQFKAIQESILDWGSGELQKLAAAFELPDLIETGIGPWEPVAQNVWAGRHRLEAGIALRVFNKTDDLRRVHRFAICIARPLQTTVTNGPMQEMPVRDIEFAIVPIYAQQVFSSNALFVWNGFGISAQNPGTMPLGSGPTFHNNSARVAPAPLQQIMHANLSVSQWPSRMDSVQDLIRQASERLAKIFGQR